MGDPLLDFHVELSPFYTQDTGLSFNSRIASKLRYKLSDRISFLAGAAFHAGNEEDSTKSKVRLSRTQPDRRLLGHFEDGKGRDYRLDLPEASFALQLSRRWTVQLGRDYWDRTIQNQFRDGSYQGFLDGNLADPQIAAGSGGRLRFHQSATKNLPGDIDLFATGSRGGRGEWLGLVQGLFTFNLFDKFEMSGWPTMLGGSAGLVNYPKGSLPALLPEISPSAAGTAFAPGIYLQQGLGKQLDAQLGYATFKPVLNLAGDSLSSIQGRSAFNAKVNFYQDSWAIHGAYGRIRRDDLAETNRTQIEDHWSLSGRYLPLGIANGVLSMAVGATATRNNGAWDFGAYAALEFSLKGFAPGKI